MRVRVEARVRGVCTVSQTSGRSPGQQSAPGGPEARAPRPGAQVCINYANERLQCYFNDAMLASEQAEYAAEGLDWARVPFLDNLALTQLLDCRSTGAPPRRRVPHPVLIGHAASLPAPKPSPRPPPPNASVPSLPTPRPASTPAGDPIRACRPVPHARRPEPPRNRERRVIPRGPRAAPRVLAALLAPAPRALRLRHRPLFGPCRV